MAGPFLSTDVIPDFAKAGLAPVEIAPSSVPLIEIYAWQAGEVERASSRAARAFMRALRSAGSFPLDPLSGRLHIGPQ